MGIVERRLDCSWRTLSLNSTLESCSVVADVGRRSLSVSTSIIQEKIVVNKEKIALKQAIQTGDIHQIFEAMKAFQSEEESYHPIRDRYPNVFPSKHRKVEYLSTSGSKRDLNANELSFSLKGKLIHTGLYRSQAPTSFTIRGFFSWLMQAAKEKGAYLLNLVPEHEQVDAVKFTSYFKPAALTPHFSIQEGRPPLHVTADEIEHQGNLKIVNLSLKKGELQGSVHAVNYANWKDRDTVELAELAMLVKEVRKQITEGYSPIVIHCSAGVGRTGTLITAVLLKEYLFDLGLTPENYKEKICSLVISLRKHGGGPLFVQTEKQLKLLFDYAKFLLNLETIQ